jgi:hypothetical protein
MDYDEWNGEVAERTNRMSSREENSRAGCLVFLGRSRLWMVGNQFPMQKHGYKKKLAGTPLSAYPPSSFSFSWTFGCVGDAEIFCTGAHGWPPISKNHAPHNTMGGHPCMPVDGTAAPPPQRGAAAARPAAP